ncbi:MAG: hypothetical protein AAGG46_05115, partial [Planctomycetota bacterium]
FPSTTDVDPGTLVQMLSMQQAEVLRNTLVNSVPKVADLAELFSRVSAVGAKLSAANKVVTDRELNAIDQTAGSLDRVPTHTRDGVEVTPADNERFKEIDGWAAERNLDLQPMTKVIPPPTKEEIAKAEQDARTSYLTENAATIEQDKQSARSKSLEASNSDIEAAEAEARAKSLESSQPAIEKAEQEARDAATRKAEAEGLDADDTQALIDREVAKAGSTAREEAAKEADAAAKAAGADARQESEAAAKAAEQKVQQDAEKRADAAGQAVADEMAKIQPKTVVDVDGVAANKQVVADYRNSVENGTADNPALRASIQATMAELGLDQDLKALGVAGPINTLSDLQTQAQSMLNWAVDIVNRLNEELSELKNDTAEYGEKLGELDTVGEFAEQTQKDLEKANELRSALDRALERLDELKRGDAAETADRIRETLEDLSGSVRHAADLAQNLSDTRGHTAVVLAGLSETDQATLQDNLERWKADRGQAKT